MTTEIASWVCGLRFEHLPPRVVERAKAQILSVVAAVHAARYSEAALAAAAAASTWGQGKEATVLVSGERLPRHSALFANACASVSFDFDDYLCFGHTGHSAVCASLACAEAWGGSGQDVLTSIVAANEVGGRLGGALLLGPHNGQMWSYIHLLEGACVAARFLDLDPGRTADAIGIAFAQPPYPLMPAFMGPDSKLLMPATTTVEGCRAAELAARGWRGARAILEDAQGFLRRFNERHFGWMFSGFGKAWVTDSLCYKVVPGCAYIDTAVDALAEVGRAFASDEGRRLEASDVAEVEVRCGLLTSGMEGFAQSYRARERLDPVSVNFSVALSFGIVLAAGALHPKFLSHDYLDRHREEIEAAASKVRLVHDPAMDERAAAAAGERGVGALNVMAAGSLEGLSFERYVMSFPASVSLRTTSGRTYEATQDVPLGGAGRPWAETAEVVREKFRVHADTDAERAIGTVEALEDVASVREVVPLLTRVSPRG